MVGDVDGDGSPDISTAQGILDASGVTVPTGDLADGVYDEQGNFYQMPEFVVANPPKLVEEQQQEEKAGIAGRDTAEGGDGEVSEVVESEGEAERRREEKGKGVIKSGDVIKVRARLSDRGGADVMIEMGKSQSVRVLTRRIVSEAGVGLWYPLVHLEGNANGSLQLQESSKIKIAYLGKILKENETLPAQGWREGHVVNALVF